MNNFIVNQYIDWLVPFFSYFCIYSAISPQILQEINHEKKILPHAVTKRNKKEITPNLIITPALLRPPAPLSPNVGLPTLLHVIRAKGYVQEEGAAHPHFPPLGAPKKRKQTRGIFGSRSLGVPTRGRIIPTTGRARDYPHYRLLRKKGPGVGGGHVVLGQVNPACGFMRSVSHRNSCAKRADKSRRGTQ